MQKDVLRLVPSIVLFFAIPAAHAQTSGNGIGLALPDIPQIADGGSWVTTIVLTNTSSQPLNTSLSFYQETTGGNTQYWYLDFVEMTHQQALGFVMPAGGTLFLHTLGTAAATTIGWAHVIYENPPSSGPAVVTAYAIFTQHIPGQVDQEGTAEGTTPSARFLVPFDNTNGAVTSMAIASILANGPISVAIRIPGSPDQQTTITLPGAGHMSFAFPAQFPVTAGKTGLAEFFSPNGYLSILALRFKAGAFTTAPVYSVTGPPIIVAAP